MTISKKRLKELQAMKDSEIDYSDIPELDASFWKDATLVHNTGKKPITLRIDRDILEYYKGMGKGYQTFMNDVFAIRLRAGLSFHDHLDADNIETRTPYPTLSISLAGFSNQVTDNIRCYGEGGGMLLFPGEEFSSQGTAFSIFGVFGFEVFISDAICYVIELGATANRAVADNLPGSPTYSNGFMIGTGLRGTF